MLRWRGEWGWSAAVLAVLFAVMLWNPDRPTPRGSFDAGYQGKLAFYRTVSGLRNSVVRSNEPLATYSGSAHALLLLGQERYPSEPEWDGLIDWMASGHAVIFAARQGDPAVQIGGILEILPNSLDTTRKVPDWDEPEDAGAARDSVTEMVPGPVDWQSQGYVQVDTNLVSVLVSEAGRPQAIVTVIGRGLLIAVCSDYIFTNYGLGQESNGLLATRIVDLAGNGSLAFDETLNAGKSPRLIGLLFDMPLRPVTLQIVLLFLLFGWMGSRRFGRALPSADTTRRRMTEHAEALGSLHYRAGTGHHVVAASLDYFKSCVRRGAAYGEETDGARLARQAGLPEAPITALLNRAAAAAGSPGLSSGEAARIVRELMELKQRLGSKGEAARGV